MNYGDFPLEPDSETMRLMGEACLKMIIGHIETLPSQPSQGLTGAAEAAARLREAPPEDGASLQSTLDTLFSAVPYSLNTAGPGYLAYIPGGGLYASALADLMACSVNRYTGVWGASPPLVQLEINVIRWFCDWMGYGKDSLGILTSGGSMANFSAIVTARAARLPGDFLKGTIYATSQAHQSIMKAARLAGFPGSGLRTVRVDSSLRMDPEHLVSLVMEDRRAGLSPFLIVANAGTTNTGSIDPLEALADIAEKEGLWLHVDGAYGGFFNLTARGRTRLSGIERAHSITLDPHKGLFLPYGTGCLLVRRGKDLKAAHHIGEAHYLQDIESPDSISFSEYSPELSREFRGIRVWLPLKLYGARAFRDALDEKLDLTEYACEKLRSSGLFRIIVEPELSIVSFQAITESGCINELNAELLSRVNGEKRVFLSSTRINGENILRICVLSFRSHRDRIDDAVEALVRNARGLIRGQ